MKIPNADYLERTGSENLGAALAFAAEEREHAHNTSARRSFISCWKAWGACASGTKR